MDLSIIICTYNRSWSLSRLVQGFCDCAPPESLQWEIVFIDNNSSDNTEETIKGFSKNHLNIIYKNEKKQGLSYARNRGIKEALGRFLFFMDDDASPGKNFLVAIEKALRKYPNILCFGTKVISHFPDKPDWFATEGPYALVGILGIYDLGDKDKELSEGDPNPIGSGSLVNKNYLLDTNTFYNTNLGLKGNAKYPKRSEDTDLMKRIRHQGVQVYYLSEPIVNHYPDLSRYNFSYLRRIYIGSGIGLGEEETSNTNYKRIYGVPKFYFKELFIYFFKSISTMLTGEKSASVYYKTRYWFYLGKIWGSMKAN